MRHFLFCLMVVCLCPLLAQDKQAVRLQRGDRVMFLGDSITDQGDYPAFVQQYVYARHRDWNVRFYRNAWSGENIQGLDERLARDVFPENPSLAILCYGMNDGAYQPVNWERNKAYMMTLDKVVSRLKEKGTRVILMGPTCADVSRNANLDKANYNNVLGLLNSAARSVALKHEIPFIDILQTMLVYQNARKAEDPSFTMIPDGIHPDGQGHLLIARELLKVLGVDVMDSVGGYDFQTGASDRIKLDSSAGGKYRLTATQIPHVPLWVPDALVPALMQTKFLDELSGQRIVFQGLPQGRWSLSVSGANVVTADSSDFASGVLLNGQHSLKGRLLNEWVNRKDTNYRTAWRDVRIHYGGMAGGGEIVRNLLGADEGFDRLLRELAEPPQAWEMVLEQATP